MIKKNLYLTFFVLAYCVNHAQTINLKTDSATIPSALKKVKTLTLSTEKLSETSISDLKDELSAWDEKVLSITILEKTHEFILVHNNLMDEMDLFDVLKKYNINKENIISYK